MTSSICVRAYVEISQTVGKYFDLLCKVQKVWRTQTNMPVDLEFEVTYSRSSSKDFTE